MFDARRTIQAQTFVVTIHAGRFSEITPFSPKSSAVARNMRQAFAVNRKRRNEIHNSPPPDSSAVKYLLTDCRIGRIREIGKWFLPDQREFSFGGSVFRGVSIV